MSETVILPGVPPVIVTGENTAEAARQAAIAESAADTASLASDSALAAGRFRTTKAAAEAAFPTEGSMIAYLASGVLTFAERTAGGSTVLPDTAQPLTKSTGVTLATAQTITGNKTFKGAQGFALNGSRLGITDTGTAITPQALVEIKGTGVTTNGFRVSERWTGSTATPYSNNDTILIETFNNVLSDSANLSWSGSFPNAYNNIPVGVHDSGERVGVYGWATSVHISGQYEHAGWLTSQIGVRGRAGFQGTGHPITARISSAVGVRGEIRADSPGVTINNARAGSFVSEIGAGTGTVENNTAVYAEARGGTVANWAYYSAYGEFYQEGRAFFGAGSFTARQSACAISARGTQPNAVEFGNGDPAGYGSNIGATAASGNPFIAFHCEADASGNTFRTRGRAGSIIKGDAVGQVVFSRVSGANASGQTPVNDLIWRPDGKFLFAKPPRLYGTPPASATASGEQWEVAVDADYIYVCVADNTWKRVAIATW